MATNVIKINIDAFWNRIAKALIKIRLCLAINNQIVSHILHQPIGFAARAGQAYDSASLSLS